MKNITVCFTGHRKIGNSSDIRIYTEIEIIKLINRGITRFLCGMACGFDQLAAQLILEFKPFYPHIKLIAALPCPPEEQTGKWGEEEKATYYDILEQADEVITLSERYHKSCMLKRNKYMVDNSQYCISYLTKEKSGTGFTVKMAKNKNLEVVNIARKIPIKL